MCVMSSYNYTNAVFAAVMADNMTPFLQGEQVKGPELLNSEV